uniref:Orphan peptide AbOp-9 n=1 Tax=Androctonus bicolor TaxID=748906 RepID=A0A0K0LC25_9SCOR|nr:orphan peptide AbOp-9 [Androctonus bicolor]
MKISIAFVLGMIMCNFVCINGGDFDEYCSIPASIRELVWDCIYRYLPQSEKAVFTQMSLCFGVSTFDKVINQFCGLSDDEQEAVASQHEVCLSEIDFDNFHGPTVSESQTQSCIRRKLG